MNQSNNVEVGVSTNVRGLGHHLISYAVGSCQLGILCLRRLPHLLRTIPMLGRFYRVLRLGQRHELPMNGDGRSWAYGLKAGHHSVVVAFNRSPLAVRRRIELSDLDVADGTAFQGLTHNSQAVAQGGSIDGCLEGRGVRSFVGRHPTRPNVTPACAHLA